MTVAGMIRECCIGVLQPSTSPVTPQCEGTCSGSCGYAQMAIPATASIIKYENHSVLKVSFGLFIRIVVIFYILIRVEVGAEPLAPKGAAFADGSDEGGTYPRSSLIA